MPCMIRFAMVCQNKHARASCNYYYVPGIEFLGKVKHYTRKILASLAFFPTVDM